MAEPDNEKLKPGSSATLSGALGPEVTSLLGLAFSMVPLAMAANLTMELGNKMGPAITQTLSAPQAAVPNPFELKMPTLDMKR